MAEQVDVNLLVLPWRRQRYTVSGRGAIAERETCGIIENRPSVSREDSGVEGYLAVRPVERACGAAQIAVRGIGVMPRVCFDVGHALDVHTQAFLAESLSVVA